MNNNILKYILIFFLIIISCNVERKKEKRVKTVDKVEINWGKKIDKYGNYFGISPSYLKALCVLECSGKKKIKPRFEKKVYKKLVQWLFKKIYFDDKKAVKYYKKANKMTKNSRFDKEVKESMSAQKAQRILKNKKQKF